MVYIFKCLNNLQEPFHIILPTKFTKNYLPITLIITLVFKSSFTQHKIKHKNLISQFSSVTQSCPTLCDPMDHSMPGLPVHHQLPEFTQTHVHWVGDAIQPSHPLSSPSPSTINRSQHQGLFNWVSSSHQVAKVLEFQLQHHSSKALILQCSVFFIVQLSHPYMTTGETIALTRWTFVGNVMSLLFNMLSWS